MVLPLRLLGILFQLLKPQKLKHSIHLALGPNLLGMGQVQKRFFKFLPGVVLGAVLIQVAAVAAAVAVDIQRLGFSCPLWGQLKQLLLAQVVQQLAPM